MIFNTLLLLAAAFLATADGSTLPTVPTILAPWIKETTANVWDSKQFTATPTAAAIDKTLAELSAAANVCGKTALGAPEVKEFLLTTSIAGEQVSRSFTVQNGSGQLTVVAISARANGDGTLTAAANAACATAVINSLTNQVCNPWKERRRIGPFTVNIVHHHGCAPVPRSMSGEETVALLAYLQGIVVPSGSVQMPLLE
jgi:hypothetical protein